MTEPKPTHHHVGAALRLSLRRDLSAVDGFNAKAAVLITQSVGTMWCAWLFAVIGITGIVGAVSGNLLLTLVVGAVSGYFLQLVLLPVIIVGQQIQNAASDARAAHQAAQIDLIADRLNTQTQGGITEILDAISALNGANA